MQFGFVIPSGDIHTIADMAQEAEAAGWDGVFIPDCISIETDTIPASPGFDPWIVLAALATRTARVRLGTMITAVSRRRPWKLARETATLDHLSRGRLVLPVGLGAAHDDAGFARVGEALDLKVRAQLLDEGLEIIDGLWRGQPFRFSGEHYQIGEMTLLPPPVQSPRPPIWVVAAWPRPKSLARALRYDGIIPQKVGGAGGPFTPDDIHAVRDYAAEHRAATTPFDIIMEGETPGADPDAAADTVRPFAAAGLTWWIEAMWETGSGPDGPARVRERIAQGPPRLD